VRLWVLSSDLGPKLHHFADKFIRFHAQACGQQENRGNTGLPFIALQKRDRGGMEACRLSKLLVRQSLLLPDAEQDDGERFGDFQGGILVATVLV